MFEPIDPNLSAGTRRGLYVLQRSRALRTLADRGSSLDAEGRAERARLILEIITERKPEPQRLLTEVVRQWRLSQRTTAVGMLVAVADLTQENATWYVEYLADQ